MMPAQILFVFTVVSGLFVGFYHDYFNAGLFVTMITIMTEADHLAVPLSIYTILLRFKYFWAVASLFTELVILAMIIRVMYGEWRWVPETFLKNRSWSYHGISFAIGLMIVKENDAVYVPVCIQIIMMICELIRQRANMRGGAVDFDHGPKYIVSWFPDDFPNDEFQDTLFRAREQGYVYN